MPPRKGTGKFGLLDTKAEYRYLQRLCAAHGYTPIKQQEHVRQYRLHLARLDRDQKLAMERERLQERLARSAMGPESKREAFNRYTRELSDGYVSRRLKKNMPLLKGVKLPKPLIDLERQRLMIVREVRERSKK